MFISKFAVPIFHRTLVSSLTILNTRCLAKKVCPENKTLCRVQVKPSGRKKPNKCEEYKTALTKCPKKSVEKLCCKPLFPVPAPKCESSISDNYKQAYRTVKLQAANIMKHVDETMQSITNEMLQEMESSRMEESSKMQQVFRKIEEKLSQLSKVDPAYGTSKKNKVLLLNDWARRRLETWQSNSVPAMENVKLELTSVRNDTKLKCRSAVVLVQSCRKCKSPQALAVCIKQTAEQATKMLDNASKDVKEKLINVQNSKSAMLHRNKQEAAEIFKSYSKKMRELSTQLSNCIDSINSQSCNVKRHT